MRAQRSILLHKAQSNVNGQMGINAVTNLHLQLDADDSGKLEVVHLLLLPKKKKKNKEQKIVPGFVPSIHSPSSTYKGLPGAQRTVSLQCITREDGTEASGTAENEARSKAYQNQ